jgi:hypothetical protein
MKQRTTSQTVKQSRRQKGGKKDCELGSKCPYQNEYQHQLEFNHDKDPQTVQSEAQFSTNNGHKLGGSSGKKNTSILLKGNQIYGSSSGTKLGGVGDRATFFDKLGKCSAEKASGFDDHNNTEEVFCETCFGFFPYAIFVTHIATHKNNNSASSSSTSDVDHLRSAQDVEYNNSLIADMKRQESERLLAVQERHDRLHIEEEAALLQAIAESSTLAAIST